MTKKDIEEQFFETFGIEPKWKDARSKKTCIYTEEQAKEIRKTNRNIQLCCPSITADVLLRLICIYNNNTRCEGRLTPVCVEELKEEVLYWLIKDFKDNKKVKQQVRSLFEEVNQ